MGVSRSLFASRVSRWFWVGICSRINCSIRHDDEKRKRSHCNAGERVKRITLSSVFSVVAVELLECGFEYFSRFIIQTSLTKSDESFVTVRRHFFADSDVAITESVREVEWQKDNGLNKIFYKIQSSVNQ